MIKIDSKEIRYFIASLGFPIVVAGWLLYERYVLFNEILEVLLSIKAYLEGGM